MNRRQKRKQFKKATGMTPEQWEVYWREHWPEIVAERIKEAGERAKQGFIQLAAAVRESGRLIQEEMKEWAEEIQAAAGFMETEEMLSKSLYLPEGVEKELLQDKGLRADRSGAYWHFYYDEANEEYFVELIQERREPDGSSTH